ncbi:MAG: CocE/NonD family hydrolase [Planctomycetes bacterium]|nr:CocE/NonD family hydrolase [Planctomycetota bacterium]
MQRLRFLTFLVLLVAVVPSVRTFAAPIEENVRVAMRDGVRLSTDLYLPSEEGKFPTLLMRTPYDKSRVRARARKFTGYGYAVVVQDCRGRLESDGEFYAYRSEGQDGFDTQEWVGQQSWCDGSICTFGASYVGGVQWLAAPYGSSYLKAMVPQATFSNFYNNLYLGGAIRIGMIAGWAARMTAPSGKKVAAIDFNQASLHLPLYRVDEEVFGWHIPMLRDWTYHRNYDAYWEQMSVEAQMGELDLPAYHIVGVYDFFLDENVKTFKMMTYRAKTERARRGQKLLLGPWDHGTVGRRQVGEVDFGPHAQVDIDHEHKRWFDHHLRGVDNGIDREPPIKYFVMGLNHWRYAYYWPPQATRHVEFYLESAGQANTLSGDGRLVAKAPSREVFDSFTSDPAKPIPSKGGKGVTPTFVSHWGPWDQTEIEKHPDVLVYTSQPLEEDLEIAGPVTATIYASTDARDTDLAVKLIDVHPDGFAHNLVMGIQRGRFRKSIRKPELLTPGEVVEWNVNLTHVANQFKKGHRIRLDITGSSFPLYDRNSNSGGDVDDRTSKVAHQKVFHSERYPSRVTLPISVRH